MHGLLVDHQPNQVSIRAHGSINFKVHILRCKVASINFMSAIGHIGHRSRAARSMVESYFNGAKIENAASIGWRYSVILYCITHRQSYRRPPQPVSLPGMKKTINIGYKIAL